MTEIEVFDEESDEDDFVDPTTELENIKYICGGAKDLVEVAEILKYWSEFFVRMHESGAYATDIDAPWINIQFKSVEHRREFYDFDPS